MLVGAGYANVPCSPPFVSKGMEEGANGALTFIGPMTFALPKRQKCSELGRDIFHFRGNLAIHFDWPIQTSGKIRFYQSKRKALGRQMGR